MAWRQITEEDLTASMTIQEIEVFRKSGGWESDPVSLILSRTVALVRGYIRTNGKTIMSPVATELPESCIAHAMNYAAYDLCLRWGGKASEGRAAARKDAISFFQSIGRRWIMPENYGETEGVIGNGPSAEIIEAESDPRKDLRGL